MSGSYAIVTPSFAPDFERCQLLAESVLRHVAEHVHHYIVIDRRDRGLFQALRSSRTHLVLKQDVLPWWLWQAPLSRKWWVNLKGLPARGWIVQQLTKLAVPEVCAADTYLFLDSDAFFVRSYDPRERLRAGCQPMFRELLPEPEPYNDEWHRVAAGVLGLPAEGDTRINFVTQLVTWRRDNVLALHRHIEDRSGRSWVESLIRFRALSEYVLYGTFCERVLGDRSGHYFESRPDTLNYWKTQELNEPELESLRGRLEPEHVAVMVSTKSNTPVATIRRVFDLECAI